MDPSHESIVEIAIARNTATSVKSVSQASARGYLTALKQSIEAGPPGETLQMNETDTEGLSTQSVLQYARLLMPERLLDGLSPAKNFAYKQGANVSQTSATGRAIERATSERRRCMTLSSTSLRSL